MTDGAFPVADWRDQEATNQTVFREMNEWTKRENHARLGLDRLIDIYMCECSDRRCTDPINMTRQEYEAVRAVPIRFAIAVDHENPEIDRVVAENTRFATVDVLMAGGRIARAADPRR